jgi:probable blue pigment (indigoidine) exporter
MLRRVLLTALTPMFFGSTYALTTLALPPGRPLFTAALRALPAGILLLLATREIPRGHWWGRLALLGALNIGAVFALVFVAAYRMPGGVAAVISGVQPLIVALLAVGILGEKMRPAAIFAAVAGVAGVALLVVRSAVQLDPLGIAAAAGSTVCGAVGIILVRLWGRPMPMLSFVAWQLVFGGSILAVLAAIFEGAPPALTGVHIAAFVYLGLCSTLLAYYLWFRGVEHLGPTPVSLLSLINPLTAAVLGAVLLGETYTVAQGIGAALIVGALVVGTYSSGIIRETPADPQASAESE